MITAKEANKQTVDININKYKEVDLLKECEREILYAIERGEFEARIDFYFDSIKYRHEIKSVAEQLRAIGYHDEYMYLWYQPMEGKCVYHAYIIIKWYSSSYNGLYEGACHPDIDDSEFEM